MNVPNNSSTRIILLTSCALSLLALNASFAPTALSQSGGNIVIKPSLVTGGGGSSSSGSLRIEGSIGQHTLGSSGQCAPSLEPRFGAYPASGGADYIDVTAEASCGWEAVSNAEWIVITTGWVGAGSGRLTYHVTTNAGARRKGEITIGKTRVSIKQSGM